jgi:hypothetical protein
VVCFQSGWVRVFLARWVTSISFSFCDDNVDSNIFLEKLLFSGFYGLICINIGYFTNNLSKFKQHYVLLLIHFRGG